MSSNEEYERIDYVIDPRTKRVRRDLQSRPFIAWDGEGITYDNRRQQAYVLLAASTGDKIVAPEFQTLSTQDCLDLLFKVEEANRDAVHIGFGFGYDINQILNSFSRRNLYGLNRKAKAGTTYNWRRWKGDKGYRIKVHPGKLFRVGKGTLGQDDYGCVTIYDTLGFFGKSFIEVVKSFFPERLSEIESGKGNRNQFRYSELDSITQYCLHECELLVQILDRLRENFERAGLNLNAWYGPGAVANASFRLHKIRDAMAESPKEVQQASRFAYQGGRFELFRAGYNAGRVYQYDINSAYPSVIATLPSLSQGYWEHVKNFEPGTFGVWCCSYRNRSTQKYDRYCDYKPEPLFYRDIHGRIAYPYNTSGWYWTPEAELLTEIEYPAEISITEGWVFRGNGETPFKYYEDRYYERLELKKKGDGAEYAIKLELNSGYGKHAQRSGWFKNGDRIPSYHQLEWAGYTTSATRAKLFRASQSVVGGIISFETDALFTTRPMGGQIVIGEGLGEWSETILDDLLYIQSGFYFAHQGDKEIAHYRGFDKGSISFDRVADWLEGCSTNPFTKSTNDQKLLGPTHRFVGFRRALISKQKDYWRSWESEEREITIGREGKRIHMPACPACRKGKGWMQEMHGLVVTHQMHPYGASYPHKIPWIDSDFGNYWTEEDEVDITDGREW